MQIVKLMILGELAIRSKWTEGGLEYVELVSTEGLPGNIKMPVYMMLDLITD